MSITRKKSSARINPSIKKDVIHPADYLQYELRFSCEECSHFDPEKESCTIGYVSAHHRKAEQTRHYFLAGSMALCRFHEID